VYGIYLAHKGPNPLYSPFHPSSDFYLLKASKKLVGYFSSGNLICIRTLTASNAHSPQSAITSALADDMAQPSLLYL